MFKYFNYKLKDNLFNFILEYIFFWGVLLVFQIIENDKEGVIYIIISLIYGIYLIRKAIIFVMYDNHYMLSMIPVSKMNIVISNFMLSALYGLIFYISFLNYLNYIFKYYDYLLNEYLSLYLYYLLIVSIFQLGATFGQYTNKMSKIKDILFMIVYFLLVSFIIKYYMFKTLIYVLITLIIILTLILNIYIYSKKI